MADGTIEVRNPLEGIAFWQSHAHPVACEGCPLNRRNAPFVPGRGSLDATLLVIGERPGQEESRVGAPFVGKSGRILDIGLGGDRSRTFVTNVRRCFVDDETPEEKAGSIEHCVNAYLRAEVDRLPEVRSALLIGGDATAAVAGMTGVQDLHGTTWARGEVEAVRSTTLRARFSPAPLPSNCHTIGITLHPAYAMRGMPEIFPTIHQNIARSVRAGLADAPPPRPGSLLLDPSPDQLQSYLDSTDGHVAVDVETPLDSPQQITIASVSAGPGSAVCFPWEGRFPEVMQKFLTATDRVKVGHNFAFDQRAFAGNGIEVAWPIVDTIQAAALLHPAPADDRLPWLGLKACAARLLLGTPDWKMPTSERTLALYRFTWPEVPEWLYPRLYCALDAAYTYALWGAIRPLLEREGMLRLFTEIIAPAGAVLARFERRGLRVDAVKLSRLRKETGETIGSLTKAVQEATNGFQVNKALKIAAEVLAMSKAAPQPPTDIPPCPDHPDYDGLTKRTKCGKCARRHLLFGPYRTALRAHTTAARELMTKGQEASAPFNVNSPDKWREFIYGEGGLGLKPLELTEKRGVPKVDDDTIERLQKRHPGISALEFRVALSHAQRRLSTTLAVRPEEDGRVRFAYSIHRARNGRVASGLDSEDSDKVRRSAGGNAQNIPDYDRQIYVPQPGTTFLEADWRQVEAHVMAFLARDLRWLEAFEAGQDIHALNAAAIYGCAPEDAKTFPVIFNGAHMSARQAAKRATHGWNYGLGDVKFSRMYGVSIGEARRMRIAYFAAWPGIARFQQEVMERVARDRYLINAFGRKLRFFGETGEVREEALAFLPASTVADMAKAILPVADAIPFGTLLTMTHDSFLWETDQPDVLKPVAAKVLTQSWGEMGAIPGIGAFRARVDFVSGGNWGKQSARNPDGLCEVK